MTQLLDLNPAYNSQQLRDNPGFQIPAPQKANHEKMLLVLPVPFRAVGNQLLFESQACNGLEQWADNFKSVIVAAPLIPEALVQQNKILSWSDTANLAQPERFELVPLPWAYSPLKFISSYNLVRTRLGKLIKRSNYLQFAIGGLWGDWAAVAALEAQKQGRTYAIHTDRVEHQVMRRMAKDSSLKTKLKARVIAPLMAQYHKQIIQNCNLGLWHGMDCYEAYSPFCNNSHLVHDVHTKSTDVISEQQLAQKIKGVQSEKILRICYAGRVDPMKAPLEWVQAIETAVNLGVKLHATWMGDGSLFEQMKAMIAQRGLENVIELLGFESDREKLLQRIRESHVMLFTHVTPESPRCLIESLTCGTPIIGYQSHYADDLVQDFGGGMFVPVRDWKQLGELLAKLSSDRQYLSQLIQQAGKNGSRFHDQAVFQERSQLIKSHLASSSSERL